MRDGDARRSNESCRLPQSLRVTKELVPPRGVLWPCFPPDSVMKWAALEQVLASYQGRVARTAIPLANLELTAAGMSAVDFRAGLPGKSIKLVSLFLDCLKANSGPEEKNSGWPWSYQHIPVISETGACRERRCRLAPLSRANTLVSAQHIAHFYTGNRIVFSPTAAVNYYDS